MKLQKKRQKYTTLVGLNDKNKNHRFILPLGVQVNSLAI